MDECKITKCPPGEAEGARFQDYQFQRLSESPLIPKPFREKDEDESDDLELPQTRKRRSKKAK